LKASDLKRWLESQGCAFEEGTNHWIVRSGDKSTTVPRVAVFWNDQGATRAPHRNFEG
jgi:hypothetical protein